MKLQFESNQQYQLDAIKSVVDIFTGQPKDSGNFVVNSQQVEIELEGQQLSLEMASAQGNNLLINDEQIAKNVNSIQANNDLEKSNIVGSGFSLPASVPINSSFGTLENGMNFSIEMETGTGKTYVYLRTVHELYQKYGWMKFIIVVPSVAIREGVLKNIEITKDHFAELYNKPALDYYIWDPSKKGQARSFATSGTLQIMIITIDSFAKSKNVINQQSDYGRPINFIKTTNPIVIMDEPQNMETDIRKDAIKSLNPLCTLRYSATHKYPYNMLYRLTPVDAYDKGLVKKIEVHSVLSEDNYNNAYISLIKIERSGKSKLFAQIEVDKSDDRGLQRKVLKVAPGDNLAQITGRSIYDGYIIESIDHFDQSVEFSNGKTIYVGQKDESLHEEILKRQIEMAVEDHFEKQKNLNSENIKVLSLFFIDRVSNYREYVENGYAKGKFAKWFEELYLKISTKPKYIDVMNNLKAEDVHNGYFAADKTGHWKDSKNTKGEGGKTKDDDSAYSLIMKDKERLLDINEPLRFIFSHSALREGWDNPNVFNICTLNESSSEMKKRQEIGRGLRLPVNASGERVRDESINILTVIANESYADFSQKLQTEIEDETGISFGGRIKNREDRRRIKVTKSLALDPSFKELWNKIKYKTIYKVNIDTTKLIDLVVKSLADISISRPQLADIKTKIESMGNGEFKTRETIGSSRAAGNGISRIPDILKNIQDKTNLTREIIFQILDKSDIFYNISVNPQQVIDEVSLIVNRTKQNLTVDGIKYEKTGESYDMKLFENKELDSYLYDKILHSGAIEVGNTEKTVYDYVTVDSDVEYSFMKSLEEDENIKFYIKLPGWFTIDTPLGSYNPDWAVVFDGDDRIYFVAETKATDRLDDESLKQNEKNKILSGRKHFEEIGVKFVAPTSSLSKTIEKLTVE